MKNLYAKLSVGMMIALATPLASAQMSYGFNANGGQSAGDLARNLGSNLAGGMELLEYFAYFAAFVFGILALFAFKEMSDDRGQGTIKKPLIFLGLMAFSIALPELASSGVASVWGRSGAQTASAPMQR